MGGVIRRWSPDRYIAAAEAKATEPLYMRDNDIAISGKVMDFTIKVKYAKKWGFAVKCSFTIKHGLTVKWIIRRKQRYAVTIAISFQMR